MARKIIGKESFTWHDDNHSRLSYQMVFGDGLKAEEADSEENNARIEDILLARQKEEREKLEAAREEAFSLGFEKGRNEGLIAGRADMKTTLSTLELAFEQAREEWRAMQNILHPGLLHLIFDICEKILGVPVQNETVRKHLEEELCDIVQKIEKSAQPVLWVSEADFAYVVDLVERFAGDTGIVVHATPKCLPGEYQLESNREKIVRNYRLMLRDFSDTLMLPV